MSLLIFNPLLGHAPSYSEVLTHRNDLRTSFADSMKADALREILCVGTSAGGARAKAIIAWNRQTNEVRSGHVPVGEGFGYWLLKFDGVAGNRDKELADPQGYGAVEYAYAQMAAAAGITISECRLLEEGGRRHFMTRRFDRLDDGDKLHTQSLAAIGHFDFNNQHVNSYEQALFTMRRLGLPMKALEEQVRRMLFNVVGRNHDDHVKNIAFLMDRSGVWSLSPAFDITWSYNPAGEWTAKHQMSINGKGDDFTLEISRPAPGRSQSAAAACGLCWRRSGRPYPDGRVSPTPRASNRTGAARSTRPCVSASRDSAHRPSRIDAELR